MSEQPEALRLADALEKDRWHISGVTAGESADELRRLHAENEALRKAYQKMKNVAAAYSNLCDDNGSTRRLERQFDDADAIARAAIDAARSRA